MQALFCLRDFYDLTEDPDVLNLWKQGVKTLRKNIERYDTGYWSLYELCRDLPAPKSYHSSHIQQLGRLHELTGYSIFGDVCNRWKGYSARTANSLRSRLKRFELHLEIHGLVDGFRTYCLNRAWKRRSKEFWEDIRSLD